MASKLHGKAASIRIVELPDLAPKGDVSDWLAAGGTVDRLLELAEEAPAWQPRSAIDEIPLTPAAWAARTLPPPDHLMGELYSTTSRVMIAADTGLGKSMFSLGLAFAMRLGLDFLHWTARRPARVLVLDGEMPRDLLKERIALACAWFGVEPPNTGLFILSREDVEDMPPLDSDEGRDWLLNTLEVLGGVDFAILDNVQALTVGDLREETTWKPLVPLSRELSKRKVGQLWLHHVGHDKTKAYGSRMFSWGMDAVAIGSAVQRDTADVSMRLEWQKARRRTPSNRDDFAPVHIVLADRTWTGTPDVSGAVQPGMTARPNAAGMRVLEALDKALAVWSRNVVVRWTTMRRGRRYGPGSSRQRHHDRGGPSRDTATSRERESPGAALRR